MPDPWLTNQDRIHSTDHLPRWQMPVADNQPLAILVPSILVAVWSSGLSSTASKKLAPGMNMLPG
jgi:hypothetical protein